MTNEEKVGVDADASSVRQEILKKLDSMEKSLKSHLDEQDKKFDNQDKKFDNQDKKLDKLDKILTGADKPQDGIMWQLLEVRNKVDTKIESQQFLWRTGLAAVLSALALCGAAGIFAYLHLPH